MDTNLNKAIKYLEDIYGCITPNELGLSSEYKKNYGLSISPHKIAEHLILDRLDQLGFAYDVIESYLKESEPLLINNMKSTVRKLLATKDFTERYSAEDYFLELHKTDEAVTYKKENIEDYENSPYSDLIVGFDSMVESNNKHSQYYVGAIESVADEYMIGGKIYNEILKLKDLVNPSPILGAIKCKHPVTASFCHLLNTSGVHPLNTDMITATKFVKWICEKYGIRYAKDVTKYFLDKTPSQHRLNYEKVKIEILPFIDDEILVSRLKKIM